MYIQPKQDIPMPRKDDYILMNFELYEDNKYTLDKQNIEKNHKDLISKSLNLRIRTKINLFEHTFLSCHCF